MGVPHRAVAPAVGSVRGRAVVEDSWEETAPRAGGGGRRNGGASGGGTSSGVDGGEEEEEDDGVLAAAGSDKPGFEQWVDALSSRPDTSVGGASVGMWNAGVGAVQLLVVRGKKAAVMGHVRGGVKFLAPEEALYLLDDAHLALVPVPSHPPLATTPAGTLIIPPDAVADPLPFHIAYATLLAATSLPTYLVYSHLRSAGFVVLRHVPAALPPSSAAVLALVPVDASLLVGDDDGDSPRLPQHEIRREAPISPAFDVYARDGFSSFRISAPGPPDFYVAVAEYAHLFLRCAVVRAQLLRVHPPTHTHPSNTLAAHMTRRRRLASWRS